MNQKWNNISTGISLVEDPEATKKRIIEEIRLFAKSPHNTLKNEENEPAYAEPLVGFSNGADRLYEFYKKDIGDPYLTPTEILVDEFPDVEVAPSGVTVIVWILPQTEATKTDQRKETYFPSERWARSRSFGEEFNNKLRRHIVKYLRHLNIEAVAPALSPLYHIMMSGRYGRVRTWSERHAAYSAGLGTFGLCEGLITPVGKAARIGSVIAHITIPPTPRPYTNHHAYCLFFTKGTCGQCIKRCPIGAITENGHDKELCRRYINMTREYVERHFGFKGYGCGFCQTGVPCESGIPEGLKELNESRKPMEEGE